jgi:hypothetical protein
MLIRVGSAGDFQNLVARDSLNRITKDKDTS